MASSSSSSQQIQWDSAKDALPTNLTIQKKACLRWINSILITIPNQKPINDFNTELKSGNKLIAILQKLSGQTLKSIRGRKRFERIQNVNEILKFCKNNQINTRSINSDAIVNGEERKILQLVWNIAEHYQLLKIEDKIKEVPDASSSVKGKILSWFQQIAQEYENLDITNFGQCWTDGHAFSAIIHFYRPDLLDVQFVMSQKIQDRFELIFDLAKENFGIAKLLEANEADSQKIDGKAMILYILVFLSKLPSYKERKEELELKKKRESIRDPDSDSSDDGNQGDSDDDIVEDKINVQEYEQKLRHVLNWLSNAEKTLNGIEMGNELKTTITQFHSFEKFMIDITSRQANIGFLLQQGQELLSTELAPTLSDKFVSYISQMSKRWEDLRKQSQDVQLLLHKTLNTQQMEQIKQFTKKLQELRSSVQEDTNKNNDPTTNSKLLEEFERKGAQLQGEFKTFIDTLVLVEEESDDSGNDLEEHINSLENDLQGYFAFIQERKRESQSSPDLDNEAGLAQDIESIKQWLENSHQKLIQQDDQAILDDADSFKARAEGVLLFQTQIHKCRQRITTLKKDYQELKASDNLAAKRVKPGLDQLVRQFDSLKIKAARQKAMIDKSRNRIESFDTEYEAFNLWVTGLLPKIEEFYADIEPQEVLQDTDDKEKQLQEYSNDVKANESRRSSLERLLAQLKENFGEGFLDHFQQRLDEMNDHWKKMVELLELIKAKIVASLIIQDSEGKMNAVRQWMEMTQSNVLHPNADVSSLETTLAKLADIENIITTELKSQLEVMQTVGHSLKDLGSVNHLDHTDIVNQQVNHVRDELLRLKEQLVQMESFHRFLDKENSWIVNLKEFTTRATDHIGGSYRIVGQHVQLLKELLEGHPCRCFDDVEKHAKDLVKSLDNDHYLSTVNHKLNSLRSHWQFVYTESQTATSNLSEVLKQTQLIETELNKIFKWCDQMETTYKTPITSSVERMEETNAEFLKYEGLVTTSQEMILKVLKRSPQQKKNNCYLSNQLDQLKQRWQKITSGHQDYHKASDFFLKISTLDSFLKSTKSTLDSIKLTSADTDCITSYLERCRVLKSGLADIETDIQQTLLIGSPSKIAAKEKLNVADVEVQVNKLKSYWQSLNSKIDNKIKFFETAFTIADLCSKESDELHSWLSETDKQLNERKDYARRLDQSEEDLEWSKAIQHQIIKWQIRFNEFDQKSSVLANMAEAESLDSLRTHIQTFKKQISDINDKCVGMRVYLQEYVQFMKESKKERKNLSDEIEKLLSQLTYDIAENKLLDILDEYQNLQRIVDDLGEKTLLFVQRKGVNKVLEEDMAITDLLWQSLTDKLFLVEKKKQLSSNIDQIEDDITTVNALLSFKTLNRQYLQDISKVDYNVKNTKQLLESVPTKFADLKASIDEADKKSRDDAVKEEMARLNMLQDKWDTLDVQNRFAKFAKIIELYRKVRGDLSFFTDWLSKAEVAISIARTVNDSTRAKEIEKQIPEYKIKFATLCQEIAEIYESAAASMYSGEITSIIKQFKSVLRYFRPEEFDEAVETSISDLQMIMEVSLAESIVEQASVRRSLHETEDSVMIKDETLTLEKLSQKIKELTGRISQAESLCAEVLRFPRFVEIVKQDIKLQNVGSLLQEIGTELQELVEPSTEEYPLWDIQDVDDAKDAYEAMLHSYEIINAEYETHRYRLNKDLNIWNQLHDDVEHTNLWLGYAEKMIESFTENDEDKNTILETLEDGLNTRSSVVDRINISGGEIANNLILTKDKSLKDELVKMNSRWNDVKNFLTDESLPHDTNSDLSGTLQSQIVEMMMWLSEIDICIRNEGAWSNNLVDLEELLHKYWDIESNLDQRQEKIRVINEGAQEIIMNEATSDNELQVLEEQLNALNPLWKKVSSEIPRQRGLLEEKVESWRRFVIELDDIYDWVLATKDYLLDIGSSETNKLSKEDVELLSKSIAERQDRIESIIEKGNELKDEDGDFINELSNKIKDIHNGWLIILSLSTSVKELHTISVNEKLSSSANQQQKSKWPEFDRTRFIIKTDLENIVRKVDLPSVAFYDIDGAENQLNEVQDYENKLRSYTLKVHNVVSTGEELQRKETYKANIDILKEAIEQLNNLWTNTNKAVKDKIEYLDSLLSQWKPYQINRGKCLEMLFRLEKRIDEHEGTDIPDDLDEITAMLTRHYEFSHEIKSEESQVTDIIEEGNNLVKENQTEDTILLEHSVGAIEEKWILIKDRLKAREMRLLDAIDCFSNFNSHLENALIWLVGIDNTLNKFHSSVKTSSRDPIMIKYQEENYQNLRKEIQDHESIMSQIIKAGNRVNPDLNEDEEKVLKDKIVKLQDDWARLQEDIIDIGVIIEEHCRQWNELQSNLRKLNEWLLQVNDELAAEEPLKGDLHALQQQNENLLDIRSRLATHQPLVEETLESGSLYAKSQDDRTQEDQYGDIDQQPMVELKGLLALLGDRWNSVSKRADDWQTLLDKTILEFNELTSLMREAVSQLLSCEKKRLSWVSPRDINSENLSSQLQDLKSFRESIQKNRPNIENIKRLYFSIGKKGITLNRVIIDQYSDINRRWADLTRSEQIRIDELKEFRDTTTEVSHHQSEVTSSDLLEPPWEKSLTVNNVPYYVNHEKKVTQWDHPQMTEIYDLLVNNNFIKYAAYRTAMKLRKLQKCLFLNFIELNSLKTAFQDSGLRFKNDAYIDINDIYKLLNIVYERINNKKFSRKKIPLYKDLVVNWLLNVYDVPRTGKIRILSLRIGLVILCNAPLEEKYRYMFNLIARHDGCTDKARLGLFLHDCLQIPRQLGEVAAFGGSNIEPSIRSCLETGNSEEFVGSVQFLDWMLAEPQSMVWLPVMHRISAAENVSHQTRCSVCKTAAFKGLRYRCLECFNFDMCQACFFKGETCKGHKSSHQMQEYCLESSTGDDAKDFFKFVRNKLKTKSMRRRSRKLGYLPLQSVVEGDSVESPSQLSALGKKSTHKRQEIIRPMHSRTPSSDSRSLNASNTENEQQPDEEHQLIAQYCQSLNNPSMQTQSPMQILTNIDGDQTEDLDDTIVQLEKQSRNLQSKYDSSVANSANSSIRRRSSKNRSSIETDRPLLAMAEDEEELSAEAVRLKEDKNRLEKKMAKLEIYNKQLEGQLKLLKNSINETRNKEETDIDEYLLTSSSPLATIKKVEKSPRNGSVNRNSMNKNVDISLHITASTPTTKK